MREGYALDYLRSVPSFGALHRWRRDFFLAAVLAVLGAIETSLRPELDPHLLTVPTAVASGLALGFRRVAPLWSALSFMALLAGQSAAGVVVDEGLVFFVEVLIVAFSVAAHLPARGAVAGLAMTLAAVWTSVVASNPASLVEDLIFSAIVASTPWIAGRGYRSRHLRAEEMNERATRLELSRAAEVRAAVAEERSRIARELHDVIAHTVSVMGVQAAAATQLLDSDPQGARGSLEAIEASAREAVLELRRLLDVMRHPGDKPELTPQPGLGQLDGLVEQVRSTGLEVNLSSSGTEERLSPGVELAAYRVLQESLTNVVKHAQARSVHVAIRHEGHGLEVEVTDDGNGRASPRGAPGHGLIGMRERTALYGGLLEAGPGPKGGWRVLARLSDEGGRQ